MRARQIDARQINALVVTAIILVALFSTTFYLRTMERIDEAYGPETMLELVDIIHEPVPLIVNGRVVHAGTARCLFGFTGENGGMYLVTDVMLWASEFEALAETEGRILARVKRVETMPGRFVYEVWDKNFKLLGRIDE